MLVEGGGFWCRDRVERFFAGAEIIWEFTNNGSVGAELTSSVFDFNDPGEGFFVWVIDLHGRLPEAGSARDGFTGTESLGIDGFSLESKGAVGQMAKAVAVEGVDRASINDVPEAEAREDFAVVGVQKEHEFIGCCFDHTLEHAGVASGW